MTILAQKIKRIMVDDVGEEGKAGSSVISKIGVVSINNRTTPVLIAKD